VRRIQDDQGFDDDDDDIRQSNSAMQPEVSDRPEAAAAAVVY